MIVLDEGTPPLPEGMKVHIEPTKLDQDIEALCDLLLSVAGKAEGLPPTWPRNTTITCMANLSDDDTVRRRILFPGPAQPGDAAYSAALRLAIEGRGLIVTTAWVLTEVADAMAAPANRPLFLRLIEGFRTLQTVQVVPAEPELFDRGLDLYAGRPDKAWSLTDCISFEVMTDRGLTEALTGDHHFEQAGFQALLR